MKATSRKFFAGALALAMVAAPAVSFAQSRLAITVRPAVVAAPVAVTPVAVTPAPTRAVPAAIIVVTPTPLPPLPPNFCFRGNSSGVSRC